MSVQEKMTAIANAIRAKTGKTETLTLEQMATEILAIESGGSGRKGVYMAQITPTSDLDNLVITHNLGTTDVLLVAAWAETLGDIVPNYNNTLAKFWAKTNIKTQRGGNGFSPGYAWNVTNNYSTFSGPNAVGYESLSNVTENSVTLPRCSSGTAPRYCAGVTYTVIVIAAANAQV